MSLQSLAGETYGPFPYRTCREKVSEYVSATADDPARWGHDVAPPSLAGALLFVVAPHLLSDPRATTDARSVIHGDQSFVWHGPLPVETDLAVAGTVAKVRERSGVSFVAFDLDVTLDGVTLVEGTSTFLMSGEGAPPGAGGVDEPEPPPHLGSVIDPLPEGTDLPVAVRGASRADLVRYAAASRDWNPIHWDHDAARAAGLSGVVVHGLLQSAWILSYAARLSAGQQPVRRARFRYRAPLRPGVKTTLSGRITDETTAEMALSAGDVTFVTSNIEVVTQ